MAERKVLTKYYPPDFDPAALTRRRGVKKAGPKLQPVRLMAPFSMRCLKCNDYIYKGRKFNARKETLEERYYSIPIYRFYICCPSCSAEICFKTDPRNMDYQCERGARRNFEPWRDPNREKETDDEMLRRYEQEEGVGPQDGPKDAMAELEKKQLDVKTEIAIADALDEIRARNARNERTGKGIDIAASALKRRVDNSDARAEAEDAEAARRAFAVRCLDDLGVEEYEDEEDDDRSFEPDHNPDGDGDSHGQRKRPKLDRKAPSVDGEKDDDDDASPPPPPLPPPAAIDFSRKPKPKPKARSLIKGLKAKPKPDGGPLKLGY